MKCIKKLVSILLLSCLMLSSLNITVYAYSGQGDGTVFSPYIITTKNQLNEIRNNLTAYYKLNVDIDLGGELWEPIGKATAPFKGILDGDGYIISNLNISRTDTYNGLFSYIDSATIKNIKLDNVYVVGKDYTGSLIGYMKSGQVENCSVSTNGKITGTLNTGGLIGYKFGGTILKSSSNINVSGTNCTGGLVGYNRENVDKSYATGNVEGSSQVGGLIGYAIQGNADNTIENCFASGDVNGYSYCGGLIGLSGAVVNIMYSYSCGKVTARANDVGGLFGSSYSTITSCYFNKNITGFTTPTTQARTTEELKTQSNYVGWDFTDIWIIEPGEYPELRFAPIIRDKYSGGSGTVDDPYIIANEADLRCLSYSHGYDWDKHFLQTNDISLSPTNQWTPIGNIINNFTGTYDGNNHTVSNIYITDSENEPLGFFGYVHKDDNSESIKNLGVINVNIDAPQTSRVGALAGMIVNGSIERCYSAGIVRGDSMVGGLIGTLESHFSTPAFQVINCYSTANATASNFKCGGLVGRVLGSSIKTSYAEGAVTISNKKSGSSAGGLIGMIEPNYYSDVNISVCYSKGSVNAYSNAGGLIGYIWSRKNTTDILNCYSSSNVEGCINAGAFIGAMMNSGTVKNCYAVGSVNSLSFSDGFLFTSRNIGGFIGTMTGSRVENCFAANYSQSQYQLTGQNEINFYYGYEYDTETHNCFYASDINSNQTEYPNVPAAISFRSNLSDFYFMANLFEDSWNKELVTVQNNFIADSIGFDEDKPWGMDTYTHDYGTVGRPVFYSTEPFPSDGTEDPDDPDDPNSGVSSDYPQGKDYFTPAQVFTLSEYYLDILDIKSDLLHEIRVMYDSNGNAFSGAVPYAENGQIQGFLVMGVRNDGPCFYVQDPVISNYEGIKSYSLDPRYKVEFVLPCYYYYKDVNSTFVHQPENEGLFDESLFNEGQRAETAALLEILQQDTQSPSLFSVNNPPTIARLSSETDTDQRYINIVDYAGNEYYGGNQAWWNQEENPDDPPYKSRTEFLPHIMAEFGCGPVAFANVIAYHIGKDYEKFGDLLKYTNEPKWFYPEYGVKELNENYNKDIFNRTYGFTQSNKLFYRSTFRDFMDFYADMGDLPTTFGVIDARMKQAFDQLRHYTGYGYIRLTPSSNDFSTVEGFLIDCLNDDIPVLMLNYVDNFWHDAGLINEGLKGNHNFDTHWMTITKYYIDNSTNESYFAMSSWGTKYFYNAKLLVRNNTDECFSEFSAYKLLPQ